MDPSTCLTELAAHVRIAKASDRVYRDECMYSFDSPLSPDGIYTNLKTFESFGASYVALDRARSSSPIVYWHQRHTKVLKTKEDDTEKVPSKLAIGGEGGFSTENDKYDVVKHDTIVVFEKQVSLPLTSSAIPSRIIDAIEALKAHVGNTVKEEVSTWCEERKESKYVQGLIQVENPRMISSNPSTWKCCHSQCDKRENLWMNLSDGYIGCGRQNWDGTGGCGEALRHYEETGKMYPLAVKLGTITSEGGDVYSYASDEDEMVLNSLLPQHLLHFGIQIKNLKKTEKSMDELQVDLNLQYDFNKVTEAGKQLESVTGAGFIGFKNMGNSCYINSVVQLLLNIPEVQQRYYQASENIFQTCRESPADDFSVQFAKLACAVLSDRYGRTLNEATNVDIRPSTFRTLIGKGHADFSTGQQQDAVEYLQYLLECMNRSERVALERIGRFQDEAFATLPTSSLFKFKLEDHVKCLVSRKAKYVSHEESLFQLQIPVEAAINDVQVKEYQAKRQRTDEKSEKVIPIVPFEACLEKSLAPELIEDFLSSATGKKGMAQKTVRFKSFPRYLLVQMRRFYVAEDWTPQKLDVIVTVPEVLRLSQYLSTGLKEGEELLPENEVQASSNETQVIPDEMLVAQLVSMGFSENGCKRAAIATGNSNAEVAMEWIFNHMEDADFNEPLAPSLPQAGAQEGFNMEHVSNLTAMGFTEEQVKCALGQTSHNPDRAAEWLFSHMDDLDSALTQCQQSTQASDEMKCDNQVGDYALMGFISHVGRNSNSGHYVCHLKKNGRWVIFNDDQVAYSEEPPFDAGYLYLFRRTDETE